ncbi:MAG: TlpA family protein disulfide reductase [Sphingomonadaceae bacterium]|nr:TlpA family protein disulfide reductase [Sphingomonadaceae bacterium]
MTLLLAVGLAACDRQSPPSGQANASMSGEVAATGGDAAGKAGKDDGFNYRLDRSKAGTPAPTFIFQNPDGGDATLQDFAGRPLLVNLWATWCTPCVAEMPTLDRVAATYGPKGLAVLTISQDNQGEKVVAPFFKKHPLPHLKGWADPENQLGFHYATGLLPTTVLYDAKGKEMVRVIGAMDWEGPEAEALIDAAMAS